MTGALVACSPDAEPVALPAPISIEAWASRVDTLPGTRDLVDMERGVRLVTLALAENHRLPSVTAQGAYVAAKDDDDLERVLLLRP